MKTRRDCTKREWVILLKKNNYHLKRHAKGCHAIWTNGKEVITVQLNPNWIIKMIKEFNLKIGG